MLVEEAKKILFAEIYKLSPLAQEAVKILFEKPALKVEIIDEKHQRFNGRNYCKNEDGHYRGTGQYIHVAVYEYYNNCTVPPGYDVHHKDFNPENNLPENFQMLSHSDHQKLHAPLKDAPLITCQWYGKKFKQEIRGRQPTCCSKKSAGKLKRSKEIEKRICTICGKEFECNKFQRTQTCSKKCTSQLPTVSKNLFKPKN